MLDPILEAALVSLIVQGLKNVGLWKDEYGKAIALAVASLFFLANGLIAAYVPAAYKPLVQQAVDIIKTLLALFAVPGVFEYVKFFKD